MKRTIRITLTLLGAGWLVCWLLGKGYQKGVQEEQAKRTEEMREAARRAPGFMDPSPKRVVFDQYLTFDHQNEQPFSFNHTPAENFARVWPARGDQ